MRRLGLFRHAKSDWDDLALRDFDRGLNARGRRGASLMGGHIAAQGIGWDKAIASPAERVRLTLASSGLDLPVIYRQEAYLADSGMLIALLREYGGEAESVLLTGHNPGLQELAVELVAPANENELFAEVAEKYPTASFAILELAIEDWTECAPGCGTLVHFARPRDLDPELGPETVG